MGLTTDLGPGRVAIDTAIFIYFIEENPRFLPEILPLFTQADQGKRELITSALTLLEVFRSETDPRRVCRKPLQNQAFLTGNVSCHMAPREG